MIRLAFVGCGAVTEEEHLPALRGLPGVQVVAAVDPRPERLALVCDRFAIPRRYAHVDALIADPEVDAVGVCIPAGCHRLAVPTLLTAGKHVLVEKPPGLALEDVDEMIAAARRSGAKVMVGYHMRWHRMVRQARAFLDRRVLGPLESIRMVWYGPRDDRDLPEWRARRELGGGALIETGVDHFDLWRFLVGADVDEIFARSRSGRRDDEAAVVSAVFDNGVLGSAVFSERTTEDIEFEVCGAAGRLRVSCNRVEGLAFHPAGSDPASPRARLRRIPEVLRLVPTALRNLRQGGDFKTSYRTQWEHFLAAIRTGGPVGCTLQDGRAALQTALAAVQSATSGRPVRLSAAPGRLA
ncbi:MAG TPA: Gfo/Idh/MocA family oxidoreductase [Methylomirabilota bacterium]|jgi:myo-inositol 2-dehydrogenase/D-chiro-inositol 1-dehydrogenase